MHTNMNLSEHHERKQIILKAELKHHPETSIFYEALSKAIEILEEVQQYRAIGTPEECRAAMGKQEMSKIVDGITECCGYDFGVDGFSREKARYCPMCGRKLDWSE